MTNIKTTFSGRSYELKLFQDAFGRGRAFLAAVYGRRRVGKTRLIQEFAHKHTLWQFDGLENQSQAKQIHAFLVQLAEYAKQPLYQTAACRNWQDCFKLLDEAILKTRQTHNELIVFLDEFPYMAHGRSDIVSALKWAWDNLWSSQTHFGVVLCGSVASFMVEKVIQSSALYGRIDLEICLEQLSLSETFDFFGGKKSKREILDLYMFCGGVPEYLEQFNSKQSIHQNINSLAFQKDGYFVKEYDRVFKDTFRKETVYRKIIQALNQQPQMTAPQIFDALNLASGSSSLRYLSHLEKAGFISYHIPWDKSLDTRLKKYFISDAYILFYTKFLAPKMRFIRTNTQNDLFSKISQSASFKSWMGLAFEHLCFKHVQNIMKILKIDQLVTSYGPHFRRASRDSVEPGSQIDLIFARHDPVMTVCEMKCLRTPVGKGVISEMEKKINAVENFSKTIQKILITMSDPTKDLVESHYFDQIIKAEELFEDR